MGYLSVNARNLRKVRRLVSELGDLGRPVANTMNIWAATVIDERLYGRAHYAPARQGSSYQRTGALGLGWDYKNAKGIEAELSIYNTTEYAHYVVGDSSGRGKARVHKRRWWTARFRILKETPKLISMLQDLFEKRFSRGA